MPIIDNETGDMAVRFADAPVCDKVSISVFSVKACE